MKKGFIYIGILLAGLGFTACDDFLMEDSPDLLIPENVERIISLDSDTMVLNKVDDLWNTEMGEHPIAGVDDCMGKVALVKTQHLKENSIHCNAGMYLIDLSVWRRENWTNKSEGAAS